jgi:RNA polymerase sigma-70 factor (ECF subfamily)
VFVKLWINKSKIKIKHSVKSYLYIAVKNHSLNYINKESRLSPLNDQLDITDVKGQSPEEDLINNDMYRAVHKAIDSLPDQCRKIYLMIKYDGLSYNEITEILGISINTVKTQMKRAMKSLLKNLSYLRIIIFFSCL